MSDFRLENLDYLSAGDLQIQAKTLQDQAQVAREAGYTQLAANFERAAELTRVPNDVLLKMYEALRPRRSTYDQLMQIADLLRDTYDAPITATFIQEAADAYQQRNLLA